MGPLRVLIDGVPGDRVPVSDRGFQYGDGLFETVRLCGGEMPLWPYHQRRLAAAAARLGIAVDVGRLAGDCERLVAGTDAGVVRITVTRGDSVRGYAPPPPHAAARCVIALYPPPRARPGRFESGVRIRLCDTRLAEQPLLAGLKHLNRLEQVLARREWATPAFDEGLMLDTSGRVIEGTFSNVFLVLDGRICTPSLDRCGVAGVMRAWLLDERPGFGGLGVGVETLWPDDLARADECFLTNGLIGVWPVRTIVMPAGTRDFATVTMGARIGREAGRRLGFDVAD